jgi:hypothetical protein
MAQKLQGPSLDEDGCYKVNVVDFECLVEVVGTIF